MGESIEVNDIAGYSSDGHNYSDLCLVWFCLKCNKVNLVNPIMLSISLGVVHYVTCVSVSGIWYSLCHLEPE